MHKKSTGLSKVLRLMFKVLSSSNINSFMPSILYNDCDL